MTPPPVTCLLETSLYVADLDVSRAFYARVFGFQPLLTDERMAAFSVPGMGVLLLFRRGGSVTPSEVPGGVIPPHDGHGTQHLCFAVPLAAVEEWAAHLTACDVPLESRVVQNVGGTSLYFRDPDGHSLEVAGPGLWAIY